jgi:chaperonin GroEL
MEIGNIIQQAYDFSNIVKVEESNSLVDSVEFINGMKLDVSYLSKRFTNTHKETWESKNPKVLILDGKLEDIKLLRDVLIDTSDKDEPLLIIVEHIAEKELRKLESNVMSGNINLCAIKTPGFGPVRKDYLRDLSDFTGAQIVSLMPNKQVSIKALGELESCTITKNHSTLIKHPDINVDDIVTNLDGFRDCEELTDYDRTIIDKRIEHLTGRASVIRVGGGSEIEMKERKDRYDDAVLAVACALEEGIVEGAGIALHRLSVNSLERGRPLVEVNIWISINAPYKTIYDSGIRLKGNMFDQNIIDPLKVTRCALENAVSVAKTILSTDCIILNERQWS